MGSDSQERLLDVGKSAISTTENGSGKKYVNDVWRFNHLAGCLASQLKGSLIRLITKDLTSWGVTSWTRVEKNRLHSRSCLPSMMNVTRVTLPAGDASYTAGTKCRWCVSMTLPVKSRSEKKDQRYHRPVHRLTVS